MNPSGGGRFCGACDKVIIDFTAMSLPEIQSYFLNHSNEKTCGIFRNETIVAQEYAIPLEIIQQNYNRWKNLFILAFLVAFGFLTFGCGEEKKQEIPPIPIVDSLNNGKVGMMFEKYEINNSTKFCSKDELENRTKIYYHTTGIIGDVIPEIDTIVSDSKIDDSTEKEILMGKPIYIPDTIKKPILKGKMRINNDTI